MSTPYDSQQVKTILAERGAQVEAYLQHCLDAIPMQGRLKEAMYYSLLAGGKRPDCRCSPAAPPPPPCSA